MVSNAFRQLHSIVESGGSGTNLSGFQLSTIACKSCSDGLPLFLSIHAAQVFFIVVCNFFLRLGYAVIVFYRIICALTNSEQLIFIFSSDDFFLAQPVRVKLLVARR